MSGRTNIEWTERTWNPTRGCSMMAGSNSPECGGCYNCYAARQALRMAGPGGAYESLVKITAKGIRWTGKVVLAEDQLDAPLGVKKPAMWFVNSMSDLFHESLPFKSIARIISVMKDANWHTYQVLTKRADRLRQFSEWYAMQYTDKLPAHIWFGISAETQETFETRGRDLILAQLTGVRFCSLEPLLAPINLEIPGPWDTWIQPCSYYCDHDEFGGGHRPERSRIDWVIVGGESGPGARPFDLAWARQIIAQCKAAGVPVFMKQIGSNPREETEAAEFAWKPDDRKGGDPAEWPVDLRVREFPEIKKARL